MKCSNCGAELADDARFCAYCGVQIESQEIPATDRDPADNSASQSASEKKTLWIQIKEKAAEWWGKLSLYGKMTAVSIAVFTLLCFIAVLVGKTLASILAALSLILVIAALLIKKEIIKTPKRWLYIVMLLLAVVLLVPYFHAMKPKRTKPAVSAEPTATISDKIPTEDISDKIVEPETAEEETPADDDENTVTKHPEDDIQKDAAVDFPIDYTDAESFERALNNGEKVNGKIVQFDVNEYHPDSVLGINCWSGEHLNFISEEELDVDAGAIIVGRVTEEPSNVLGSWKIPYAVLAIDGEVIEYGTPETPDTLPSRITMTMDADDFKGMDYEEADRILREMGFTSISDEIVDAETESDSFTVSHVEITDGQTGSTDFIKGDTFDPDATVTIFTYLYCEPETPSSVFYSSNDYETATEGNTGVFSYASKGSSYDIYWIIDFDAGYVYYFTDGNGGDTCDRLKIEAGDLNTSVTITYHESGTQWSYYLHFKYVGHPETLIMLDNDGFDWEYTTTDLDDALELRDTKRIKDY